MFCCWVVLLWCRGGSGAGSTAAYRFATNIVGHRGDVFELDADEERRGGEEGRVDLCDGGSEGITLSRGDGGFVTNYVERHLEAQRIW